MILKELVKKVKKANKRDLAYLIFKRNVCQYYIPFHLMNVN